MSKAWVAVGIAALAVLAFQVGIQADNPQAGARVQANEGGQGAVYGQGGQYYAYVPPVPVPPGVLGVYTPLPCAVPSARTGAGFWGMPGGEAHIQGK